MSLAEIHVAVLNKHPQELKPNYKHLVFSDDMTPDQAIKKAKMVAGYGESAKGMTFIEKTTEPATVELDCDLCNSRTQKHPHLFPSLKSPT